MAKSTLIGYAQLKETKPLGELGQSYLSGTVPTIARWLIIMSVPATIVWTPVANASGLGTVTLQDVILLSLWPMSFWAYFTASSGTKVSKYAIALPMLAILLAISTALGAVAFSTTTPETIGRPLVELSTMMKRFGFASIIPLAMALFASPFLRRGVQFSLAATLVGITLFALFPDFYAYLPIASAAPSEEDLPLIRSIGAVTNPNDYAYICLLGVITLTAITKALAQATTIKILMIGIAVWTLGNAMFLSASRSALIALGISIVFLLLKLRMPPTRRVMIIIFVALVGAITIRYGFASNDVFNERVLSAVNEGANERNLSARVSAQRIALAAALENPMGVGFSNMPLATREIAEDAGFSTVRGSDNIFVDFFLAGGWIAGGSLIVTFVSAWKLTSYMLTDDLVKAILQSGCIAALTFGMATIAPASAFVAPLFFSMVGASALLSERSQNSCHQ